MNSSKVLLGVVAMTFAVFGGYKAASAYSASHNWPRGVLHSMHALSDDDWSDPEKMSQLKQACVDSSIAKFDTFIDHMQSELDITEPQTEAWDALKMSIQEEHQTFHFVCGKILTRENTANLPARLELLSVLIETGQESLQRLSPAINQLYAVLDTAQQAHLEELISRHHNRHGIMHH